MNKYTDITISKQVAEDGHENFMFIKNDKVLYCGTIENIGEISYILSQIADFFGKVV